jgi:hypothetical protein
MTWSFVQTDIYFTIIDGDEIMKRRYFVFFILVLPFIIYGQSPFSAAEYADFLKANENLSSQELLSRHAPQQCYYKGSATPTVLDDVAYYDSVRLKYQLTDQEAELLKTNHFVVTERLKFNCFGHAFHDIYVKDLPVFLTTDAVLHALHISYDRLLMDMEIEILEPNLIKLLDQLYSGVPALANKYASAPQVKTALEDVDLYVTIANSLIKDKLSSAQLIDQTEAEDMWQAIQSEKLVSMPLFSDRLRKLDFSQFTVRGHYTYEYWGPDGKRTLGNYFKAMMWLGRMEFMLTPPPENPWEEPWSREEIQRMVLGAFLLNDLVDLSTSRSLLDEMDEIIKFMVGESDNLTPKDFSDLAQSENLDAATALLDDATYDRFQELLLTTPEYGQKILSNFLMMDPFSTEPGQLPVSFRLMGQRFIVDSYVFANVVFDRIVFNGKKIWRPLPDPLDAMFVLGNDDALPLLNQELEQYKYASQLAALRYLVDAYDQTFWDASLYNVWLNAIRTLNPPDDTSDYPFFMTTAAWHQQKLNTQLASWVQLRHDNLLYAKQSYTGATGCSFPHSFIEPYPAFYRAIAAFASKAEAYFNAYPGDTWTLYQIRSYFPRLKNVMEKLELLAEKELAGEAFSQEEIDWLGKMLFVEGGSGAPPYSGWYAELFYIMEQAVQADYVIADVHTQPTDQFGSPVGRVLHVGMGDVNLGVFIAESSTNGNQPVAFVGPVMSYYEKITENWDRLTDERWAAMVEAGNVPARPDWVNIYLADAQGRAYSAGRELPSVLYTGVPSPQPPAPGEFALQQNYPNPFNPSTTINYTLARDENVRLTIYNTLGQQVALLVDGRQPAGTFSASWNAENVPSGVYVARLQAGGYSETIKMVLMR